MNKRLASEGLRAFAVESLDLARVHEDAAYELFVPVDPPACESLPARAPGRWERLLGARLGN